jgi:hypothetical protein
MTVVERPSDGLIAAQKGETCIAIWRSKPHQMTFGIQRSMLDRTVAAHPGRAKFLCVVEPDAPAPDDDVREASADMVNEHGDRLSKVACVIEGDGFRAVANRAVLAAMSLFVRSPVATKFFGSVDSAACWLMEAEGRAAAVALELEVRDLRKRLDVMSA